MLPVYEKLFNLIFHRVRFPLFGWREISQECKNKGAAKKLLSYHDFKFHREKNCGLSFYLTILIAKCMRLLNK